MERRLAAILAADVVGYTALMGVDEAGTLRRMTELRQDILEPLITEHHGRIVKLMGDGLLVEFASVVDTVACALAWQENVTKHEADGDADTRLRFRIGINLGDVIEEGDDIHGEGVNIAARLEGLAEPGGICLSSDAYRQAKGRIEAEFEDMGEQALKNVAEPVRVYRIAGDSSGTASAAPAKAPLALPDKPSIAVLPFTNMSGDPEQEYFADGMVEEITAALSRVRSFFVIAWSSAFAYRNKTTNVREIAKELSVRYLLEGSVRRSGDRVRIMAELLQGDDGHQIWAGKYEGTMDDVFEFQDSITSAIVGVIQPTIREAEIRRSRRKPPSNLQAYDYVMQAFAHAWMLDRAGNKAAMALLEKAMAADPSYALAFALASWCEAQKSVYQWAEDLDRAKERSLAFARKAFSLDPNDPTVLAALGEAETFAGEMDAAVEHIERALEYDPNSAWAWGRKGWLHYYLAQFDQGVAAFENALRLSPKDPMNFNVFIGLGLVHFMAERYADAIEYINRGLRENPDAIWGFRPLSVCYAHAGCLDEARECVDKLLQEYPNLTVDGIIRAIPHVNSELRERYRRGLILAGVPEDDTTGS